MTADNNHAYAWDTDGHLTSIDAGSSNGVCLTYDALGRAVEKDTGSACVTSPTSSTEIVYGPSGSKLALMNGSSLVKAFVPLPGGAQAVYNSSGLQYYRHPDWLGSSRLATTTSQTVFFDGAYAPFGENYAQSGTQDLSFTGQNQDTESSGAGGVGGLYDFLYRYHSPVQGRWLSPDPAGIAATKPHDPQTWNRYAYVGNRPLQSIDSLGLLPDPWCQPDDPFCGGCDPSDASCGGCDPSDPSCGGCDPTVDPTCGGPPGGPPGYPILPAEPQPTGGVWPNNETTGLPTGLNTSPLSSLSSLLGLLPGLPCGGGSGGSSLIGASSSSPCPEIEAAAAAAFLAGSWRHIFGIDRQVSHCEGPGNPPTMGVCLFACENRDGTFASGPIGFGQLRAACGPIPNCPRDILLESVTFWVLGVGVSLSEKITQCIP